MIENTPKPFWKAGYWTSPQDREHFSRAIGGAIDVINDQPPNNSKVAVESMIFQEPHKAGGHHFHAIVVSDHPTCIWHRLEATFRGAREPSSPHH